MPHRILLLTPSDHLARRIQQLLTAASPTWQVEWLPYLTEDSARQQWNVAVVDEDLLQPPAAAAAGNVPEGEAASADSGELPGSIDVAAAIERWRSTSAGPAVVLLASGPKPSAEAFRRGVVDCVQKDDALRKLTFVVQQQLTAHRLRLARRRYEETPVPDWPAGFSLRHEINNPLAGILGNAELALASPAKLPADVRQRLETIAALAVQIRDILNAPRAAARSRSASG
jgi:hypothetical protein